MSVTPDSYDARVSAAVVTMLANCATFRILVGADDAAGARAFIVEDDGGTNEFVAIASDGSSIRPADTTWAGVRMGAVATEQRAWMTYGRSGSGEVHIHLACEEGDTPPEVFRRARNAAAAIRSELEAQLGQPDALVAADIGVDEIVLPDETGANAGKILIPLSIDWRDLP